MSSESFSGGGEMGHRIRNFDWSQTPLGPIDRWSPALRTMVQVLLANRFPMLLWWGPEYISIYNDSYRPVLGAKHPWGLGTPVRECWGEIWDVLRPLIDTPFFGGPPTWNDDIELEINRHGFLEETHFVVAYSPVPDDTAPGGIGGVLATVNEITEKVIGERRLGALRDLGAHTIDAHTAEQACVLAAELLAAHRKDVPFALFYIIDEHRRTATLAAATGVAAGDPLSPRVVALDPDGKPEDGVWSELDGRGQVSTISSSKADEPAGLMVLGISPRLRFDENYRAFFELIRRQVGLAIANARAKEEERKRAQALAEIDRAKTSFFANISHEFRTPLTLMLGPLDEALDGGAGLSGDELALVARNARRLLALVNKLLDFSRIEAGRVDARFTPVDLSQLTADLASSFRSAMERAGLRFTIDAPPLPEPIYVDVDMWEKIVLNLLSNALKFTLAGEVEVRLSWRDGRVQLDVRDTGSGIPSAELPRIFERFHRVLETEGRTHEGTGIGLALASELVKLHGGTIGATSTAGGGTTFTVRIPAGHAHLPAALVAHGPAARARRAATPSVVDTAPWLPAIGATPAAAAAAEPRPANDTRGRVLIADDNADMRAFLRRLLSATWAVETVGNGEEALAALHAGPFDLVVSDVMMPRVDGFELLRRIRGDAALASTPVILLSARAGEDARVQGLGMGADDYIVKPFSARELVARVGAQIELTRYRLAAERERQAMERRHADALRDEREHFRDLFTGMLGHDLRSPLSAIVTGVQTLLHRMLQDPTADERTTRTLARVDRSAARMARMIEQLLDFTRLRSGGIPMHRTRIDLGVLCRAGIEELEATHGDDRLEAIFDGNLRGNWDPDRLSQVVSNLVGNALVHGAPGEPVRVAVVGGDDDVTLRVHNAGDPIEPELLPHIFDPFRRSKTTRRSTHDGLGLGLYIAHEIVRSHGGTIDVSSTTSGTVFEARLPRAAAG